MIGSSDGEWEVVGNDSGGDGIDSEQFCHWYANQSNKDFTETTIPELFTLVRTLVRTLPFFEGTVCGACHYKKAYMYRSDTSPPSP